MVSTIIGNSAELGGVLISFCNEVMLVLGCVGVTHVFILLFNKYESSLTLGRALSWVLRIE